jgi:aspartate/methionine/tyrosine aminotransferase
VRELRPSKIREMSLRAAKLDGVISLGIGEPDFQTAPEICRRALADALAGATHYAPSQGDPELLDALRGHMGESYGLAVAPENLMVTTGGMGALTAVFRTILNPGDEVLVPEPHFPEYRAHIELAGGKVVHVPTRFDQEYVLTARAVRGALTERAKVLLLNTPNNPTGAVIPGAQLDELAELAREKDLLVVCDEVYDQLIYDGRRHESIATRPGMAARSLVIGSFSKTFAMTGWRLGYAFGPPEIIAEMTKVAAYYTSCAASVSQRAGLAALRHGLKAVGRMVAAFQRRRDLVFEALSAVPGVRVTKPAGAFYIFPDVGEITRDVDRFVLDLLDQERVVVIPGTPFGPSGRTSLRMAFTVDLPLLEEAMTRFARFAARRPHRPMAGSGAIRRADQRRG